MQENIERIARLIVNKNLVDLRPELETIFKKKAIDFAFSPLPHFKIKTNKGTIVIVNKKYADKAEKIVDQIAIGYEGKI